MLAAKRYYLERFQAGDPIVMYDVQAPVPEQGQGGETYLVRTKKKVTSTNQYGYTSTKWEDSA